MCLSLCPITLSSFPPTPTTPLSFLSHTEREQHLVNPSSQFQHPPLQPRLHAATSKFLKYKSSVELPHLPLPNLHPHRLNIRPKPLLLVSAPPPHSATSLASSPSARDWASLSPTWKLISFPVLSYPDQSRMIPSGPNSHPVQAGGPGAQHCPRSFLALIGVGLQGTQPWDLECGRKNL